MTPRPRVYPLLTLLGFLLFVLFLISFAPTIGGRMSSSQSAAAVTAGIQYVTTTDDSGPGSLREAILQSNALASGTRRIVFNISTSSKRICPTSPLPDITKPVHIDGTTQSGYAGTPLIILNGSCMGASTSTGLTIKAGGSTVQGLVIQNFTGDGINLNGGGSNKIIGNYIGTRADGLAASANKGNGILVSTSSRNQIGGPLPQERNVISGNGENGISIPEGSTGNWILNNLIGTNAAGTAAVGNGANGTGNGNGISIRQSDKNTIGGPGVQYRNIISGNGVYGINIAGDKSSGHVVQGNYVGTDITGSYKIPNIRTGILLHNSPNNQIGGYNPLARNVISGNNRHGINLDGSPPTPTTPEPHFGHKGFSHDNLVVGNYIGTNASGTGPLGNGTWGIIIFEAQTATIQGNLISGNTNDGIWIRGDPAGAAANTDPLTTNPLNWIAHDNNIIGNKIGTDVTGQIAIRNARDGIYIKDALNNSVGKDGDASSANIIKFNPRYGVEIAGTGAYATSNTVSSINTIVGNGAGAVFPPAPVAQWQSGTILPVSGLAGIACTIGNARTENGQVAGLAQATGGYSTIAGLGVTACFDIDFGSTQYTEAKIGYRMLKTICGDSCSGTYCSTYPSLHVFTSTSRATSAWSRLTSLAPSLTLTSNTATSPTPFRYVRVCRGGGSAAISNAAVDYVLAR
ncbi:MAG: right-handed parallel beta-helix repeat-containing protein [bacterium]|nr:right-handed parallel beta-helix repeat-containing protein [bacterium]